MPIPIATPAAPVAELRGVGVSHDAFASWALRDLDLVVRPTDRWVVIGPNGCGKTTLARLLSGWLHPTTGDIALFGGWLGHGVDWRALRAQVGLHSAAMTRQLRPEVVARDVVMTSRHGALETWWHDYTDDDEARAQSLLDAAGFGYLADRSFGVMSEGERQQIQIARTLMVMPELLVLDEPAAGLDLGARERLVARMAAVAADPSVPAMVLVTHHVEEIPPGMTHALLLRSGRVVAKGRIADVLTSANVSNAFDLPVTIESREGRFSVRLG